MKLLIQNLYKEVLAFIWKSNIKGENLCSGQKIEPKIESPIENTDNKYLKIRKIEGFEERYISFRHIIEIKFTGVDDNKVKIVEYEGVGLSLESFGGRSNIGIILKLIDGEELKICLSDYYVEIDDINKIQEEMKYYMSLDRYR